MVPTVQECLTLRRVVKEINEDMSTVRLTLAVASALHTLMVWVHAPLSRNPAWDGSWGVFGIWVEQSGRAEQLSLFAGFYRILYLSLPVAQVQQALASEMADLCRRCVPPVPSTSTSY